MRGSAPDPVREGDLPLGSDCALSHRGNSDAAVSLALLCGCKRWAALKLGSFQPKIGVRLSVVPVTGTRALSSSRHGRVNPTGENATWL